MAIDWQQMFALSVSPLELIIRGSLIYCFLFLIFRVILRRDVGAIGIADVVVLVLIADAASNAMSGEYKSITDGVILVSTIVAWNVLLDWLSFRSPRLRAWIQSSEICLIRDGRVLHRNLRREFMTEDDLRAKLREYGITDFNEVRAAFMESDGVVSVIKRHPDGDQDPPKSGSTSKIK
jgi:uncharacterized membrane protein YcaP (DUF421 family)